MLISTCDLTQEYKMGTAAFATKGNMLHIPVYLAPPAKNGD